MVKFNDGMNIATILIIIKHHKVINNTRHNFLNASGKLIHNHHISSVIQAVIHIAFLTTSGL